MSPDALSLTGLLLVFLSVMLDLFVRHVEYLENTDPPPPEQHKAFRKFRTDVNRSLLLYGIPMSLTMAVFAYSILPSAVNALAQSEWQFWNFKVEHVLIVILDGLAWTATAVAISRVIRLVRIRARSLK